MRSFVRSVRHKLLFSASESQSHVPELLWIVRLHETKGFMDLLLGAIVAADASSQTNNIRSSSCKRERESHEGKNIFLTLSNSSVYLLMQFIQFRSIYIIALQPFYRYIRSTSKEKNQNTATAHSANKCFDLSKKS